MCGEEVLKDDNGLSEQVTDTEQCMLDSRTGEKRNYMKKTSVAKKYLQTRCAVQQFVKIIKSFDYNKLAVIESLGFGGLTRIKLTKLDHTLIELLATDFDCKTLELNIHGRKLKLSPSEVQWIMGLPSNGEDVEKFLATDEEMKQRFNLPKSKINISDLTRDLEILPPNEEFRVKFLLYVVSTVIRPSSSYNQVNTNLLGLFKDPQLCCSLNWAKYTLEGLVQGIRKYQEKNHDVLSARHISGCTLLLEIFYLENFALGPSKIPDQLRSCPRIMDWDNDMVNTTLCQLFKLRKIGDLDGSKNKIVDQKVVVSSSQRVSPQDDKLQKLECKVASLTEEFVAFKSNIIVRFDELQNAILDAISRNMTKEYVKTPIDDYEFDKDRVGMSDGLNMTPSYTLKDIQKDKVVDGIGLKGRGKQKKNVAMTPKKITKRKVPGAVPHSSSSGIIVVQADKKRRASRRSNLRSTRELKKGKAVSSPFVGQQCKGKHQPKVETVATQESSDSVHTVDIENLLKDAVMEISRYVFEGSDHEKTIICDFGNHYATKGDFTSMRPRETISSVILDVVANALTLDEIAKADGHKNWYLPTYFAQMALGTSENRVTDDYINHLKKGEDPYMGNLSTVEKIFIPINEDCLHWYLCLVKVKERRALILDSLQGNSKSRREADTMTLMRVLDVVCAHDAFNGLTLKALPMRFRL